MLQDNFLGLNMLCEQPTSQLLYFKLILTLKFKHNHTGKIVLYFLDEHSKGIFTIQKNTSYKTVVIRI